MGNPSTGSKVQTTMSLPKGRHRQSLSVGASSLEKLAPHDRLSSNAMSPRNITTEEKSIAAFLGDKKVKRRTRSSLGGSEEFVKGFELHGALPSDQDRKPLTSIPFRGQRRAMSGNVTPRVAESPRAKAGAEKSAVAKTASSLFHSPTNLERSMSLSRLAHRTIPDADGSYTPRCRTGVLREVVILPGDQRSTLAELKRQDFKQRSDHNVGSGRRSSSVLLEKKLEGAAGGRKAGKTAMLYAHGDEENVTDSWPNQEQMYWNPAYLPVKDIHPVCFETTTKLRGEQPMTSRSLDMGYDLHGLVRRSTSFSTVTSAPLLPQCSSRRFNPEDVLKSADSVLHSETSEYRLNHCDVLHSHPETRASVELPTPSRKQSLLDLTCQDFKSFHCHPLPLPPTSKTSQVKVKDQKVTVPGSGESSDKVSEEDLTEAAVLSSLHVSEEPAVPEEIPSKQLVGNASPARETDQVGSRNTSADTGACLRKSLSFEPGLEEKARIEHEKKTKLRKRRRSVSASGIGAMLLKVVRVADTGPVEMSKTVPLADLKVDPVKISKSNCCAQTSAVQSGTTTTIPNEDAKVETQRDSTEALDMDVDHYQDCSVELVTASDVDACHKVNAEGVPENKDHTRPLPEDHQLPLRLESKLKSSAEGISRSDAVLVHGSHETEQNIADSELGTTSWNSHNQVKREVSSATLARELQNGFVITTNDPNKELVLEETVLDDASEKETSSTSAGNGSKGAHMQDFEKGTTNRQQALVKNARLMSANSSLVRKDEHLGGSRRKLRQGHKLGRVNSYDLDSSTTDCRLKKPDMSEAGEARTLTGEGQEPDEAITRESTRSARSLIVSMLQVSPRQSLDDDYHLAPSSISILANPSFSSSHQDRIWEEQAEAYSSGGRGTPGRDDDATATNIFLHSPSPGGAISSDDQVHSAARGSLRRGQGDMSVRISAASSDNGLGNEKLRKPGSGHSKKRGRPRTPLRSLMAQDLQGKTSSDSHHGHHFFHQLMSRIRGSSSSKSSSPESHEPAKSRRHTIWSTCFCFPH